MIWATTQHYADFEVQIRALLGEAISDPRQFDTAKATLSAIFMDGLSTGDRRG